MVHVYVVQRANMVLFVDFNVTRASPAQIAAVADRICVLIASLEPPALAELPRYLALRALIRTTRVNHHARIVLRGVIKTLLVRRLARFVFRGAIKTPHGSNYANLAQSAPTRI